MKKVDIGAIVRAIFLVLTVTNQILVSLGKPVLPISESDLNQIISGVLLVISTVAAYWKNNNITESARDAQRYLDELKVARKLHEQLAEPTPSVGGAYTIRQNNKIEPIDGQPLG